ncbi:hypothetical protein LCGC14_2979730 [marine sediment metagenome]|uniref:DUF6504 domain-containing protein n=1 Tax=marine sediment metagenome TaxID=412755 RepID=A0A0F8X7V1_9ZZZZ
MSSPDGATERFVSEPLVPDAGTADPAGMARGEPGLPGAFTWRGMRYAVAGVLETWKTSRREGGSPTGELYLRRHWYRIVTTCGRVMTVYCQRQAGDARGAKRRWWLYTIQEER